jgi:hypothetical protein
MMIGRGNRSTRRRPAPVPLCPPQTPHACPDANPGRRGGKPATNCLSYCTALQGQLPFFFTIQSVGKMYLNVFNLFLQHFFERALAPKRVTLLMQAENIHVHVFVLCMLFLFNCRWNWWYITSIRTLPLPSKSFPILHSFYHPTLYSLGRSNKLLMALVSTVILGSEFRGTHDHILLSHESGIVQLFCIVSILKESLNNPQ